jgi:hypothetical protein
MLLHFGVEIVFPRMWWAIARDAFQLVQEDKFCQIRKMMSSKPVSKKLSGSAT